MLDANGCILKYSKKKKIKHFVTRNNFFVFKTLCRGWQEKRDEDAVVIGIYSRSPAEFYFFSGDFGGGMFSGSSGL